MTKQNKALGVNATKEGFQFGANAGQLSLSLKAETRGELLIKGTETLIFNLDWKRLLSDATAPVSERREDYELFFPRLNEGQAWTFQDRHQHLKALLETKEEMATKRSEMRSSLFVFGEQAELKITRSQRGGLPLPVEAAALFLISILAQALLFMRFLNLRSKYNQELIWHKQQMQRQEQVNAALEVKQKEATKQAQNSRHLAMEVGEKLSEQSLKMSELLDEVTRLALAKNRAETCLNEENEKRTNYERELYEDRENKEKINIELAKAKQALEKMELSLRQEKQAARDAENRHLDADSKHREIEIELAAACQRYDALIEIRQELEQENRMIKQILANQKKALEDHPGQREEVATNPLEEAHILEFKQPDEDTPPAREQGQGMREKEAEENKERLAIILSPDQMISSQIQQILKKADVLCINSRKAPPEAFVVLAKQEEWPDFILVDMAYSQKEIERFLVGCHEEEKARQTNIVLLVSDEAMVQMLKGRGFKTASIKKSQIDKLLELPLFSQHNINGVASEPCAQHEIRVLLGANHLEDLRNLAACLPDEQVMMDYAKSELELIHKLKKHEYDLIVADFRHLGERVEVWSAVRKEMDNDIPILLQNSDFDAQERARLAELDVRPILDVAKGKEFFEMILEATLTRLKRA